MDWVTISSHGMEYIKKYRYVLLVVAAGILLMTLPETKKTQNSTAEVAVEETSAPELQDSLAQILSQLEGAGKVEVLLTQAEGEKIHYQTDENISTGEHTSDVRRDTVLISGADRQETGLIRQIDPPVYQGAVILCQGAEKAGIRLAIVEAVMAVTGLTSDKITVLKMK